ncbi:hypothetical protein [Psychromarinibacter sp. S121]|uniref:hypothetical protein n=1 Tax=Psychromarinibacter sp. S121 TaxID=3415127 RepID=UPI003C7CB24E
MTTPKLARDAGYPQSKVTSPAGATATRSDVLQGKGPFLLGIAGKTTDPRAILLMKTGEVIRAGRGDRTPSGTVLAIGADQVQLKTSFGHVLALTLAE